MLTSLLLLFWSTFTLLLFLQHYKKMTHSLFYVKADAELMLTILSIKINSILVPVDM